MKKLISELESMARRLFRNPNANDDTCKGFDHALQIVHAHNPWHEVAELPPEHEKVLVQYGDDSVLMGIMDSENKWSVFWSDGLKNEDPDRPVVKWAYLPEANK